MRVRLDGPCERGTRSSKFLGQARKIDGDVIRRGRMFLSFLFTREKNVGVGDYISFEMRLRVSVTCSPIVSLVA